LTFVTLSEWATALGGVSGIEEALEATSPIVNAKKDVLIKFSLLPCTAHNLA